MCLAMCTPSLCGIDKIILRHFLRLMYFRWYSMLSVLLASLFENVLGGVVVVAAVFCHTLPYRPFRRLLASRQRMQMTVSWRCCNPASHVSLLRALRWRLLHRPRKYRRNIAPHVQSSMTRCLRNKASEFVSPYLCMKDADYSSQL